MECKQQPNNEIRNEMMWAYPTAENLINGGALLQRALGHDFGSHFFHVEHEGVEGFLYVRLLLLGHCK